MAAPGRLRWAVCLRGWEPAASELDLLLSWLPAEERTQCERFRQPADKQRALVSRLLARRAAAVALGLPQGDAVVKRTRGGKPYVANELPGKAEGPVPNWNYSVSHEVGSCCHWTGFAGAWAAVAVGIAAGWRVAALPAFLYRSLLPRLLIQPHNHPLSACRAITLSLPQSRWRCAAATWRRHAPRAVPPADVQSPLKISSLPLNASSRLPSGT